MWMTSFIYTWMDPWTRTNVENGRSAGGVSFWRAIQPPRVASCI